jgi:hypothetical protein
MNVAFAMSGSCPVIPQLLTFKQTWLFDVQRHSRDSCGAAIVIGTSYQRRFAPAGLRRGGSRSPIGRRNHFLTLKCRKSGGGWSFLIGIKLPSAPSIYCSLPMNTSLRSSVQLFSVHIAVGKRV